MSVLSAATLSSNVTWLEDDDDDVDGEVEVEEFMRASTVWWLTFFTRRKSPTLSMTLSPSAAAAAAAAAAGAGAAGAGASGLDPFLLREVTIACLLS